MITPPGLKVYVLEDTARLHRPFHVCCALGKSGADRRWSMNQSGPRHSAVESQSAWTYN